jgi:tetratricopeptide (TPR) repeat protein
LRASSFLLLWTVAVLAFGHWQHDRLRGWVTELRFRLQMGISQNDSNLLVRQLRAAISAEDAMRSNSVMLLQTLADVHVRRREYAEAISTFQRGVIRAPANRELLNNFAWLLLTAEDFWYRDPARALPLAERAYRLKAVPHVIDTLAEACYQTGDYQRAVQLEEQALALRPGDSLLYQRQLQKFRLALKKSERAAARAAPILTGG